MSKRSKRGTKVLGLLIASILSNITGMDLVADDSLPRVTSPKPPQNEAQKSFTTPSSLEPTVSFASHEFQVNQTSCEEPCLSCKSVTCDGGKNCCPPWWTHRSGAFGEFLYLSPGNSDLIFAREETDPLLQGSPTGPLGILNVDASPGFRVGTNIALDSCSSLFGTYTRWDGSSSSRIQATGINILNPVLLHPSTLNAGSTGLESFGIQTINFQFADMGYRRVLGHGKSHVINWSGGLRYGNLEQQLNVDQTVSVATGLTNLRTDIDFDGFGFLAGLDGERQSQDTGLLIYGKALGSLMAGDWKANARQTNQFGGGVIANNYRDFRLSPVFEAELGCGWQSANGKVRLTSGFLASGWFNAISTRDYLQSFNSSNFVDMNDTVTFSGLVSKIEFRR